MHYYLIVLRSSRVTKNLSRETVWAGSAGIANLDGQRSAAALGAWQHESQGNRRSKDGTSSLRRLTLQLVPLRESNMSRPAQIAPSVLPAI